jgi:hypothetical protein
MTQTGTRRFCFPAFIRRIFFAAGLFLDISSTFSDSSDGRIAAALGLLCKDLLQRSITHWGTYGSRLEETDEFSFDGFDTLCINQTNSCQSRTSLGREVSSKKSINRR